VEVRPSPALVDVAHNFKPGITGEGEFSQWRQKLNVVEWLIKNTLFAVASLGPLIEQFIQVAPGGEI
jgi:hypothetical protein